MPLPVVFQSSIFKLPLQPLISCLTVLSCVHLAVSVGKTTLIRCVPWILISTLIYVFHGMHRPDEETSLHDQTHLRESDSLVAQEINECTHLEAR